jgi:acyl carrier protein
MNIQHDVYKIIASVLEVPVTKIKPDLTWHDSDTDSFALVELIVALQEYFDIKFESPELKDIKSVQDMVNAVEAKLRHH